MKKTKIDPNVKFLNAYDEKAYSGEDLTDMLREACDVLQSVEEMIKGCGHAPGILIHKIDSDLVAITEFLDDLFGDGVEVAQ